MKRLTSWKYALPSALTLASLLGGFGAILLAADTTTSVGFATAALFILGAIFCDACDGAVARLTGTQTVFGGELDSICDVVAFGVAPAFLVHRWALAELGLIGALVAFAYVACGALRLARFNVLTQRPANAPGVSVGLSIPMATAVLLGLVFAYHQLSGGSPPDAAVVALITLALAGLMISPVEYRTYKALRVSASRMTLGLALAVLLVVAAVVWKLGPVFLVAVAAYACSGPLLAAVAAARRVFPGPDSTAG